MPSLKANQARRHLRSFLICGVIREKTFCGDAPLPVEPELTSSSTEVPLPSGYGGSAQSLRLLAAVVLAIGGGLLARHFGARGIAAAQTLGQFGQIWLSGLRMTLIPLVFCLMTAGIASIARTATGGAVARTALIVFLLLLIMGSVLGVFTVLGAMALWPVAPLHNGMAAAAAPALPSLLGEFVSLVPTNPIASAAEGLIAPLIIFAAFFGAAIARIQSTWTDLLLEILNAIAAALLVIIAWVLRVAPLGIFFLLLATAATVGSDAAKGVLQYAVLSSVVPAAGILVAQAVGCLSGIGAARFSRAALPPQTLAATTQSSTACLPILLQAAANLQLSPAFVGALMPLAVATFRFGNVFAAVATGLVGAALFGIHPAPPQIAAAIGIGVLTNIGSVGVPGAAVLLAAWGPVYLALGTPIEALTLYIAVITVPDICITICNVTADLAATAWIARLTGAKS